MSIYGANFTSAPVSSDNVETTFSFSGRIATREIRETIGLPIINLIGDLPINLEWKGSTNQLLFPRQRTGILFDFCEKNQG